MREHDVELIERARRGDERAFAALVARYERAVFSICLRMLRNRDDAADLAQEAFVRVFRMLDRYDPAYAFSSWLFKITSNLCIDRIRRRRIETVPMDDPAEGDEGPIQRQFTADGPNPEQLVLRAERIERLSAAIDGLPEHYRLILTLRHEQHLAYEEIARVLDVPLGTVKARIHRARAMLRERLAHTDFFDPE